MRRPPWKGSRLLERERPSASYVVDVSNGRCDAHDIMSFIAGWVGLGGAFFLFGLANVARQFPDATAICPSILCC